MNWNLTSAILITLFSGLLLFRLAIPFAERHAFVDVPNSRRRHAHPMPIIGGVTLCISWALGIITYAVLDKAWFHVHSRSLLVISISVVILLVLGLVDDLRGLGPKPKLFFQLLAAVNVIAFEPTVHAFCEHWDDRVGMIIWPGAVIWLVGLSNAINLIDGIDGLAGGISGLVACSLLFISHKWGDQGSLPFVLMAVLIPAIFTFLRKNWHPAQIFLGDNGSLPIGFLFGVLSLMCPPRSRSWVHAINIILMMGYPIMDMGLCTYRRFMKGTPLFKADRTHLHHRLLRLGIKVPQVATLLLSLTLYLQLTSICVIDMIRTETELTTYGLIYMCTIVISLFSLFFLLRAIERKLTQRLSSPDERSQDPNAPRFRTCTVIRIELEPLFETGLFEEKDRVHDIVASLKLMMRTLTRKEDLIYIANQRLNIVLPEARIDPKLIREFQEAIRAKLKLFQNVYSLQYSLADLPVSFDTEEYLIHNNTPKVPEAAVTPLPLADRRKQAA